MTPTTRSTTVVTLLVALSGLTATATANHERTDPQRSLQVPGGQGCALATIRDLRLPAAVEIDEIRVQLHQRSPAGGGVEIAVESLQSDRVLRVDDQSKSIGFWPALHSNQYRVTVLPSFDAAADACVESIELRSRGKTITTVRP